MTDDARRRLVDLIEREALDPVLRAREEDYPEDRRGDLRRVKRASEAERERFRGYGSAEEVLRMYRDDLASDRAEEVDRRLERLRLPRLADIRDRLEAEARTLGLGAGGGGQYRTPAK
jgi:hypothetical protein